MTSKIDDILDDQSLAHAAECLKTIAHPMRLKMVSLLLRDDFTVGELAEHCGMKSHVASEHLRLMEMCQLLSKRRDGRKVYYQVTESHLSQIMECIESRFGGST